MSIKRVKLMRGVEAERFFAVPVQGEPIMTTDELKLYLGDGNKAGGFMVNADNTIAIWPDQTDATKKLSLAWWIAYFNGNEATIRIPRGTHEILYDMTIPENICLKFDKGASLKVADTKTLTINGAIEAGLWQIFGGEGTVTGAPQIPYVYPEWFGAVGDGITDDVAAVQAAIAIPAVIKLSKPYLISDTLSIDGTGCTGMVWEGYARTNRFLYTGIGTAIEVSGLWNATGYEFRVQKSSKDWVSEDAGADRTSIGIHFLNGLTADWVIRCEFNFKYVNGFAYGIKFDGVFTWNKADIGCIADCWTGMYFDTYLITGDYHVWNNQNTFIGGEIKFQSSTLLSGSPVTGSTMLHLNGNGNTFLGFCLEDNNMEWCVTGDGNANQFINTRLELVGNGKINLLNTRFVSNPNVWSGYSLKREQFTKAARLANSILGPAYYDLNGSSGNTITIINNVGNAKKILTVGAHNQPDVAGALTTGRTLEILPNKISTFRGDTSYPQPTVKIDGSLTGRIYFSTGAGSTEPADGFPGVRGSSANNTDLVLSGSRVTPVADATTSLGTASLKWSSVYATNGTIQTSDERAKTEISSISEEWLDAWGDVEYIRFKMSDAVQKKGSDNARWHLGIIAQRVKEAFEARGLDAMKIGLLCYDEWDDIYEDIEVIDSKAVMDEEGNIVTPEVKHTETVHSQTAGNLYSIRYDEALAMEAAYMRREVERLKSSINV